MYSFPVGVIVEAFRLPFKDAVKKAAVMGAKGIQMFATYGETTPEKLTKQKRVELLDTVKSEGLVFSAVCGDFGKGFGNPEQNPKQIEESKRIIDLALDLGTNIVTTHIGVVPEDPHEERYQIMQEACGKLAAYADSVNAHFAVETGPEKAETLCAFLDSLHSEGVAVNLDPANLCMVVRDDPVKAVHTLKKYIVHTHAKDGVNLRPCNPAYIYKVVHPVPEEYAGVRFYKEMPLGTGQVDWKAYLEALDEIGYRGFLTIEREVGDTPEEDIQTAFDYLTKIIRS